MSDTEQIIEAALGCALAILLLVVFIGLPTVIGVGLGVLIGMALARGISAWRERDERRRSRPG